MSIKNNPITLLDGSIVQKIILANYDGTLYNPGIGTGGVTGLSDQILTGNYISPADFNAVYNNTNEILLSGHPTISDEEIDGVKIIPASGKAVIYKNGVNGITMRYSANIITVTGISVDFVVTDKFQVVLNRQQKAYDTQDFIKQQEQSPLWARGTNALPLVSNSNIGVNNNEYVDQGVEIPNFGFTTLVLFVHLIANDSIGNQIQVLMKHESGGVQEYEGETSGDYQKVLGDNTRLVPYRFEVKGFPYIQVQSKATNLDTGGGTIATLDIKYTLTY